MLKWHTRSLALAGGLLAFLALTVPARATLSLFPVGQNWNAGTDGAFAPTSSVQIDLSQAPTGSWDQDNTANAGKGVYDPQKWAVVFKYSSVNIPAGVTVTFKNHGSRAPVVWLVNGDVTISGTARLDGGGSDSSTVNNEPGAGGFRGGLGSYAQGANAAGFGPGGGTLGNNSGNYGQGGYPVPTYGNKMIVPLIGGSGGSGAQGYNGYAGGGAILIAASGNAVLNGVISASSAGAYGNERGGSGGAIRLIADSISGSGALGAYGELFGRIRLEANHPNFTGSSFPGNGNPDQFSVTVPPDPAVIWAPVSFPTVKIANVGAQAAPADPRASFAFASQDVNLPSTAPVTITLQATNVPVDGTWDVYVRVVPLAGNSHNETATLVSGDATSSVWQITNFTPSQGTSALQARASKQ